MMPVSLFFELLDVVHVGNIRVQPFNDNGKGLGNRSPKEVGRQDYQQERLY